MPAQVPEVEPGQEVQEGQKSGGGHLVVKVFSWLFWRYSLSLLLYQHGCPLPRESGAQAAIINIMTLRLPLHLPPPLNCKGKLA